METAQPVCSSIKKLVVTTVWTTVDYGYGQLWIMDMDNRRLWIWIMDNYGLWIWISDNYGLWIWTIVDYGYGQFWILDMVNRRLCTEGNKGNQKFPMEFKVECFLNRFFSRCQLDVVLPITPFAAIFS
jgi:hypothetical protein